MTGTWKTKPKSPGNFTCSCCGKSDKERAARKTGVRLSRKKTGEKRPKDVIKERTKMNMKGANSTLSTGARGMVVKEFS